MNEDFFKFYEQVKEWTVKVHIYRLCINNNVHYVYQSM